MRRERFLGPYRSYTFEADCQRYYVRGHSPWVELLFHPSREVHEHAQAMLDLDAKYDRRWTWWSVRVPPPLYTLQVEDKVQGLAPTNDRLLVRLTARLIALYAAWRALR